MVAIRELSLSDVVTGTRVEMNFFFFVFCSVFESQPYEWWMYVVLSNCHNDDVLCENVKNILKQQFLTQTFSWKKGKKKKIK